MTRITVTAVSSWLKIAERIEKKTSVIGLMITKKKKTVWYCNRFVERNSRCAADSLTARFAALVGRIVNGGAAQLCGFRSAPTADQRGWCGRRPALLAVRGRRRRRVLQLRRRRRCCRRPVHTVTGRVSNRRPYVQRRHRWWVVCPITFGLSFAPSYIRNNFIHGPDWEHFNSLPPPSPPLLRPPPPPPLPPPLSLKSSKQKTIFYHFYNFIPSSILSSVSVFLNKFFFFYKFFAFQLLLFRSSPFFPSPSFCRFLSLFLASNSTMFYSEMGQPLLIFIHIYIFIYIYI